VINEGKINSDTLDEFGLDEKWLTQELKKNGYKNTNDVFYAEIDRSGQLFIMPMEKNDYS